MEKGGLEGCPQLCIGGGEELVGRILGRHFMLLPYLIYPCLSPLSFVLTHRLHRVSKVFSFQITSLNPESGYLIHSLGGEWVEHGMCPVPWPREALPLLLIVHFIIHVFPGLKQGEKTGAGP